MAEEFQLEVNQEPERHITDQNLQNNEGGSLPSQNLTRKTSIGPEPNTNYALPALFSNPFTRVIDVNKQNMRKKIEIKDDSLSRTSSLSSSLMKPNKLGKGKQKRNEIETSGVESLHKQIVEESIEGNSR